MHVLTEIRIVPLPTGAGMRMPVITVAITDFRSSGHIMGTAAATTAIAVVTAIEITGTRDTAAAVTILGGVDTALSTVEDTVCKEMGICEVRDTGTVRADFLAQAGRSRAAQLVALVVVASTAGVEGVASHVPVPTHIVQLLG